MNQKFTSRALTRCLGLGALLCSAALASADTQVTFQVDMSVEAGNGLFISSDAVFARGTFDGWSTPGSPLTNNPTASNPFLYSGTFDDTDDANGNVMDWQYVFTNNTTTNFSSQADGDNYAFLLPSTSGASATTPVVFFDDDGTAVNNNVTFQVDMSEQINIGAFDPTTDGVYLQGNYLGWNDGSPLTNDPSIQVTEPGGTVASNVYVGTYTFTLATNAQSEYKFVYNNGADHYENPAKGDPDNSGNRFFSSSPVNGAQTLPIVSFSDVPYTSFTVTNNVTFELDMSVQEELGTFTNSNPNGSVEIHGDFDGWGTPVTLTNDPALGNDIYVAVIQYIGAPDTTYNYKYVLQPGTQWENVPANDGVGGNRVFTTGRTNGNFVVGPDFFSFEGPSALDDVVPITNCTVTFTVNMTNAVSFTDGSAFDPGNGDTVWINGENLGEDNNFWTWGSQGGPAQFQMTQIGSSELYTATVPVNEGQNIDLIYKYGINGEDNEAGFADNHMRYIRGYPNYIMPVDVFGSQGTSTSTEPSFGDLTITQIRSTVSLSWLGRQHVHLQSSSNLTGPWTPLIATDGTNLTVAPGGIATTNYPATTGDKFYELVYP
jgi:hypothetical protein